MLLDPLHFYRRSRQYIVFQKSKEFINYDAPWTSSELKVCFREELLEIFHYVRLEDSFILSFLINYTGNGSICWRDRLLRYGLQNT